jgi:1-aminocyclopropane-1-carboxylate deaminase/D-cysteine desulfhydrase-like pyridoxal-dependent ACC family enzyme
LLCTYKVDHDVAVCVIHGNIELHIHFGEAVQAVELDQNIVRVVLHHFQHLHSQRQRQIQYTHSITQQTHSNLYGNFEVENQSEPITDKKLATAYITGSVDRMFPR